MLLRTLLAARLPIAVLVLLGPPAGAQTFSNPTTIAIPSSGPATPYPSDILVSGIAGVVTDVNVTLSNFTHTWPADVDILLVGPQGQNSILMSDAGGTAPVSGLTLVFDDAAVAGLPSPLTSGTWRPTNIAIGDTFPEPAPTPSGNVPLAVFAGTNPNGLWSLYVVDDSGGDSGSIGGWSLTFAPEPGAAGSLAAVLALGALAARRKGGRGRA